MRKLEWYKIKNSDLNITARYEEDQWDICCSLIDFDCYQLFKNNVYIDSGSLKSVIHKANSDFQQLIRFKPKKIRIRKTAINQLNTFLKNQKEENNA